MEPGTFFGEVNSQSRSGMDIPEDAKKCLSTSRTPDPDTNT